MALVTYDFCGAENGAVVAFLIYDSVSLLIDTVGITNDSAVGTMTFDLRDPVSHNIVFGPVSRSFGSGTTTFNVAGRNLHMVSKTFIDKSGNQQTVLIPPFDIDCSWSLA